MKKRFALALAIVLAGSTAALTAAGAGGGGSGSGGSGASGGIGGGGVAGGAGGERGGRGATLPAISPDVLYETIIQEYLTTNWSDLAAELPKRTKEITRMTRSQQADVTYIRQAVLDGRPAWWDAVKQGNKTPINSHPWQNSVGVTWDPAADGLQFISENGKNVVNIKWNQGDMDSAEPGEHGFTKGDIAYASIWSALETAQVIGGVSMTKLKNLTNEDRTRLNRYIGFRGILAAAYFGTPRARRWAIFLSLDAYLGDHRTAEAFIARKGVGAMVIAEIVGHPWKYPSFRIPGNENEQNAEGALAGTFIGQFERVTPTFAEDKALRDALREFALPNANTVYGTGKMTLPNKLVMPLEPNDDVETWNKRNAWLVTQIQSPPLPPSPPSPPSTTAPTTTPAKTKSN